MTFVLNPLRVGAAFRVRASAPGVPFELTRKSLAQADYSWGFSLTCPHWKGDPVLSHLWCQAGPEYQHFSLDYCPWSPECPHKGETPSGEAVWGALRP